MIKVFSPEKTICFTSNALDFEQKKDSIFVKIHSLDELHLIYDELVRKNQLTEVCFYHENVDLLFTRFSSAFKIIEAAGGLVKNHKDEYLVIFRNGKWDLPKGKIERGETIEIAAVREVEEECGVKQLKIIKEIESTFHIYPIDGKMILKRTYWFEMSCGDDSSLVPQIEEGITDVKWLAKSDVSIVFENTYESIKEVFKAIS